MKVVIVGAGLGGLACAVACRRENIDVEILEQTNELREVGAGIQVPPNASRAMRDFGLLPKIIEKGVVVEQFNFRRYKDGRVIRSMVAGDGIVEEYGAPWVAVHRADYHAILVEEAERLGAVLRLGATVVDVNFDGPAAILEGGEEVTGDLVIGADGQWSKTREALLGSDAVPRETGDLAYRTVLTREELAALKDDEVDRIIMQKGVTSWLGPEKHIIFYPLRAGEAFNLVLLGPDTLSEGVRTELADIEEMRQSYQDWDPSLLKIISCIKNVYKWKLTDLSELPSWTKGPVTLLGDACHPTLPYQAQGAAMAVDDGIMIAKLLGLLNAHYKEEGQSGNDPSLLVHNILRDDITAVLTLFEQIRKAPTTRNIRGAVLQRKLVHLEDGIWQQLRDFFLSLAGVTRKTDFTYFGSLRWRKIIGHDVVAECERVFPMFKKSLPSARRGAVAG